MVEVSCCRVVPAWMNIKEGGATPKKVPTQKGSRGTPITGETILINLREVIYWKHGKIFQSSPVGKEWSNPEEKNV